MTANVLITAASRRVPLVREFKRALAQRNLQGRVIVTDVNPLSPAVHAADGWYHVPMANDPAYLDALLAICQAEQIGLVVPTIDDELAQVAENVPRFRRHGAAVAVSDRSTNLLCADKYATCTYLRSQGIAAAETFLPGQLPEEPDFPLFIKPRNGRGSVGAFAVRSSAELSFFLTYVERPIVQEFLDGPEFTIDMLCNFNGRPLYIVPRERAVIRAGVTDRGRTVNDPILIELAQSVARAVSFAGPVNIQCRLVEGRPVVFEINPRFSGGIPLTIAAGADFPGALLDLAAGRTVAPAIGTFESDLWMSCHEASTFIRAEDLAMGQRGLHGIRGEAA